MCLYYSKGKVSVNCTENGEKGRFFLFPRPGAAHVLPQPPFGLPIRTNSDIYKALIYSSLRKGQKNKAHISKKVGPFLKYVRPFFDLLLMVFENVAKRESFPR